MVRLSPRFEHAFPPTLRWQAHALDREGEVAFEVAGSVLRGQMIGTPTKMSISIQRDGARAACTCRAFLEDGRCAHLYALLLAADDAGVSASLLQAAASGPAANEFPEAGDPWRARLHDVEALIAEATPPALVLPERAADLAIAIDLERSADENTLVLEVLEPLGRTRKDGRTHRVLRTGAVHARGRGGGPTARLLREILGATAPDRYSYRGFRVWGEASALVLEPEACRNIASTLFEAASVYAADYDASDGRGATPVDLLRYGPEPWILGIRYERLGEDGRSGDARIHGFLERGERPVPLEDAPLCLPSPCGLTIVGGELAPLEDGGAGGWIEELRVEGPIEVPAADAEEALRRLLAMPGLPLLDVPGIEVRAGAPRGHVRVDAPVGRKRLLTLHVFFRYEEAEIGASSRVGYLRTEDALIRRDVAAERKLLETVLESGGTLRGREEHAEFVVQKGQLAPCVMTLLDAGFTVHAEGRLQRPSTGVSLAIRSGRDWFDLEGTFDFDGQPSTLPAILEAARHGARTVALGDGSVGVLPEDWLARLDLPAALGRLEGEALRFSNVQGLLLDALLAANGTVTADPDFETLRSRLGRAGTVRPQEAPSGFRGELRPYQQLGLAWLSFLEDLGVGGCLADDMGLGKTIQFLAFLLARERTGPSLVVAPRSVVFNWLREAERFAPSLRVLDYTGTGRKALRRRFPDADLVVTTYGLLRRDAVHLHEVAFDVVALDEAQAMKNPRSQTAKAARVLQARQRLALTGTPVENRTEELWSIFEFLNPGLLGSSSGFRRLAKAGNAETLARLSRALRPFLLRRTKEQVLADLPEKSEQVLMLDLPASQRRAYEEIRDAWRSQVLGSVKEKGLARSKLHVLEALLRLRQVACHPGLVDPAREKEPSAKLDVLLDHLQELAGRGHKALVFSQFTRFLALVKARLDAANVPYVYLDGKTRDRAARVDAFQNTPELPVFLVSLKAGGTGLNLTAADYVFLLDPWWNPAVERQAVDRSHRIGQTKPVHVYRLVCRNTVEEKVLELQAEKRKLAETLLSEADGTILSGLTPEDLDFLLG